MSPKYWISAALQLLESSLHPIPSELNELDWKQDLSPNSERLRAHLSAFGSYPGGGYLVFGIDSEGAAVGVSQSQSEKILSQLGSIAADGVIPALQLDHATALFRDQPVLIVKIPESQQKPVQLRGRSMEDSYMRSGGQTRRMGRQDIAHAILNSRVLRFEELEAFASDSSKEILDRLDFPALYALQSRATPSTAEAIVEDLKSQKLITQSGGRLAITNLGVLIAAKNMAEFPGHERRGVRVIHYKDKSRVNAEREITGRKGYGIAFQGLIRHILAQLPSNEVIRDAIRTQVSIYPEIALREFIANALVHQDLTITSQSPLVEIFPDRMEITNPGQLLPSISVDRIIDITPESRNEVLARFMRQLGICEERGSGIDRALEAIELYGLPPAEFREMDSSFKVVLLSPRKYQEMTREERVRACYQHCVLKYLVNEPMTNQSLRARLGISESNYPMVSKIIRDSIAATRIKPADPNMKAKRHVKYLPYWA
jgi:predicted HTH transcriptional regulator